MNRSSALLLTILLAIAVSPACSVKLPKQAVNETPRNQYRLVVPLPEGIASAGNGILMVRPVNVAPAFSSPNFVRRDEKGVYTADPYNRFLATPADDIHAAVTGWLHGRGIYRSVVTEYSSLRPTHFLETVVEELYGTTTDAGGQVAVLQIRFLVHERRSGGESLVLLDATFRETVTIPSLRGADLKTGWEEGLFKALERLSSALGR